MASTNKIVGNENMFLLLLLFFFFAKQTYHKIQGRNFFLWGYFASYFWEQHMGADKLFAFQVTLSEKN